MQTEQELVFINDSYGNPTYAIKYTLESHSMDFVIKYVIGQGQDSEGKYTVSLYGDNLWSEDFEHGDEVAHGMIKWDGCSHWYFSEYQHLCGKNSLEAFSKLTMEIYKLAASKIPNWSEDVAGH